MSSQVLFCHRAEASVWSERRKAVALASADVAARRVALALPFPETPSLSLSRTTLGAAVSLPAPETLAPRTRPWLQAAVNGHGYVQRLRPPAAPGAPVVIHLQDIHDVYEAQKNMAAILEELAAAFAKEGQGKLLVGLEGAAGALDFGPYRDFADAATARTVADAMVAENAFSGPEYFGITTGAPADFHGVETPAAYGDHVQALKRAFAGAAPRDAALQEFSRALTALKNRRYSPEQRALDGRLSAFSDGSLSLGDHLSFLADRAPAGPQTRLFLDALRAEKALDFDAVDRQRRRVVEILAKVLSPAETQGLLDAARAFQGGRNSYREFYRHLEDLCRRHGVAAMDAGPLKDYVRYVLAAEKIDKEKLLDEVDALETAAEAGLGRNAGAQGVADLARVFRRLQKLAALSFTHGEWDGFRAKRGNFARFGERLSAAAAADGFAVDPAALAALPDFLNTHAAFYENAQARDRELAKNFLKALAARGSPKVAVLVAGGFHAPGLEAALVEKGLGYAAVAPRLSRTENLPDYLASFSVERTPLERLLAGEKLFLKKALAAVPASLEGAASDVPVRFMAGSLALGLRTHVVGSPAQARAGLSGDSLRAFAAGLEQRAPRLPGVRALDVNEGRVRRRADGALSVPVTVTPAEGPAASLLVTDLPPGTSPEGDGELVYAQGDAGSVAVAPRRAGWDLSPFLLNSAVGDAVARIKANPLKHLIGVTAVESAARLVLILAVFVPAQAMLGDPAQALVAAALLGGVGLFAMGHKLVNWLVRRGDPGVAALPWSHVAAKTVSGFLPILAVLAVAPAFTLSLPGFISLLTAALIAYLVQIAVDAGIVYAAPALTAFLLNAAAFAPAPRQPTWVEENAPELQEYTLFSRAMESIFNRTLIEEIERRYADRPDLVRFLIQTNMTGGLGHVKYDYHESWGLDGREVNTILPLWSIIKGEVRRVEDGQVVKGLPELPNKPGTDEKFADLGEMLRDLMEKAPGVEVPVFQLPDDGELKNWAQSNPRAVAAVGRDIHTDVYKVPGKYSGRPLYYLDAYYYDDEGRAVRIFDEVYSDNPFWRPVQIAAYSQASQLLIERLVRTGQAKRKITTVNHEVFVQAPDDVLVGLRNDGIIDDLGSLDFNHTAYDPGLYRMPYQARGLFAGLKDRADVVEPARDHNGRVVDGHVVSIARWRNNFTNALMGVSKIHWDTVLRRLFKEDNDKITGRFSTDAGPNSTNGVLFDHWQGPKYRDLINLYKRELRPDLAPGQFEDAAFFDALEATDHTDAATRRANEARLASFKTRFAAVKAYYVLELLMDLHRSQPQPMGGSTWLAETLAAAQDDDARDPAGEARAVEAVEETRADFEEKLNAALAGAAGWEGVEAYERLIEALLQRPIASNVRRQVSYKGPDMYDRLLRWMDEPAALRQAFENMDDRQLDVLFQEFEGLRENDPAKFEDVRARLAASGARVIIGGRMFGPGHTALFDSLKERAQRLGLESTLAFIENYNSEFARTLFRAVSAVVMLSDEFLEAAATSNSKGSANGAWLIGVYDGANPEIWVVGIYEGGRLVGKARAIELSYDVLNDGLRSGRFKILNGDLVPFSEERSPEKGNEHGRRPSAKSLLDKLVGLGRAYADPAARAEGFYQTFRHSHSLDIRRQTRSFMEVERQVIAANRRVDAVVDAVLRRGVPQTQIEAFLNARGQGFDWRDGDGKLLTRSGRGWRSFHQSLLWIKSRFYNVRNEHGNVVGHWGFDSFLNHTRPDAPAGSDLLTYALTLLDELPALAPVREELVRLRSAAAALTVTPGMLPEEVEKVRDERVRLNQAALDYLGRVADRLETAARTPRLEDLMAVRRLRANGHGDMRQHVEDLAAFSAVEARKRFGLHGLRSWAALLAGLGGDLYADRVMAAAEEDPDQKEFYDRLLAMAENPATAALLRDGAVVVHATTDPQALSFSRVLDGRSLHAVVRFGRADTEGPRETRAFLRPGQGLAQVGLRGDRTYWTRDALTGAFLTGQTLGARMIYGTSFPAAWPQNGLSFWTAPGAPATFLSFDQKPVPGVVKQINLPSDTAEIDGQGVVRTGTLAKAIARFFPGLRAVGADVYFLGVLRHSIYRRNLASKRDGGQISRLRGEGFEASIKDDFAVEPTRPGEVARGSLFATFGPTVVDADVVGTMNDLRRAADAASGWGGRTFVDFVTNHLALESPVVGQWVNAVRPADWPTWSDAEKIKELVAGAAPFNDRALMEYLAESHPDHFVFWTAPGHVTLMPYAEVIYRPLTDEEKTWDDAAIHDAHPGYKVRYRTPGVPASRLLVALGNGEWVDTVQLNYANKNLRDTMIAAIRFWAENGFHLRADQAHLARKEHVKGRWFPDMSWEQFNRLMPDEFWTEVFRALYPNHKDTMVLAETYDENEKQHLRELGLNSYEKEATLDAILDLRFRDFRRWLKHTPAADLYARVVLFFNHDDPVDPGATPLVNHPERRRVARAAMTALAAAPGGALSNVRSLTGRMWRKVFMEEMLIPDDEALPAGAWDDYVGASRWQAELAPFRRDGRWHFLTAGLDGWENEDILAQSWDMGDEVIIVVNNLSDRAHEANVQWPPALRAGLGRDRLYAARNIHSEEAHPLYAFTGEQLLDHGVYVRLQPWQSHVLRFSRLSAAPRAAGLIAAPRDHPAEAWRLQASVVPSPAVQSPAPVRWWEDGRVHVAGIMHLPSRRGTEDLGVGKAGDGAADFTARLAPAGFDVPLFLPLGALLPGQYSPYSGTSLALDELVVNWLDSPDLDDNDPARLDYIARRRDVPSEQNRLLLRGRVWELEKAIARRAYAGLRASPARARAFEEYMLLQGNRVGRYAAFRALAEILGKSPVEATETELALALRENAAAPAEDQFNELVQLFAYIQFEAERQVRQMNADIRNAGGHPLFDLPYFRNTAGFERWSRPGLFTDGHPSVWDANLGRAVEWGDLAKYDEEAVARDGFRLFTEAVEYMLDLGFEGGRLDALGFALDAGPWGQDLLEALSEVFQRRGAFAVAEAYGLDKATEDRLRAMGFFPMRDLLWTNGHAVDDPRTAVQLTSHDEPPSVRRHDAWTKEQMGAQVRRALDTGARVIILMADDLRGETEGVNEKNTVKDENWRRREPVAGDPDESARRPFDMTDELRAEVNRTNARLAERAAAQARGAAAARAILRGVWPGAMDALFAQEDVFYWRTGDAAWEPGAPGLPGFIEALSSLAATDHGMEVMANHLARGDLGNYVDSLLRAAAVPRETAREILHHLSLFEGENRTALAFHAPDSETRKNFVLELTAFLRRFQDAARAPAAAVGAQHAGDLAALARKVLGALPAASASWATPGLAGAVGQAAALGAALARDERTLLDRLFDAARLHAVRATPAMRETVRKELAKALVGRGEILTETIEDPLVWRFTVRVGHEEMTLRVRVSDLPALTEDPFQHSLALNRGAGREFDIVFQQALFELGAAGFPQATIDVIGHEVDEILARARGLSPAEAHEAAREVGAAIFLGLSQRAARRSAARLEARLALPAEHAVVTVAEGPSVDDLFPRPLPSLRTVVSARLEPGAPNGLISPLLAAAPAPAVEGASGMTEARLHQSTRVRRGLSALETSEDDPRPALGKVASSVIWSRGWEAGAVSSGRGFAESLRADLETGFPAVAGRLLDLARGLGVTPDAAVAQAMADLYAQAYAEGHHRSFVTNKQLAASWAQESGEGLSVAFFHMDKEEETVVAPETFADWLRASGDGDSAAVFLMDGTPVSPEALRTSLAARPDGDELATLFNQRLAQGRVLFRPGAAFLANGQIDLHNALLDLLGRLERPESDVARLEVFSDNEDRLFWDSLSDAYFWAIYRLMPEGALRVSISVPAAHRLERLLRSQA